MIAFLLGVLQGIAYGAIFLGIAYLAIGGARS